MKKIIDYLGTTQEIVVDGMIVKSPLVAVLQESRVMTGRDIHSGEKMAGVSYGSWLGAVGYMIAIDQIGDKFYLLEREKRVMEISEILSCPTEKVNSFIKTLAYFSDLSIEEIFALYALRCSFVHDYFLYNNMSRHFTHHFSVAQGEEGIGILPSEKWDGNLENRNSNNVTVISLEALGDLVEDIHKKLFELATKDELNARSGAKLESVTYKK